MSLCASCPVPTGSETPEYYGDSLLQNLLQVKHSLASTHSVSRLSLLIFTPSSGIEVSTSRPCDQVSLVVLDVVLLLGVLEALLIPPAETRMHALSSSKEHFRIFTLLRLIRILKLKRAAETSLATTMVFGVGRPSFQDHTGSGRV